MATMIRHIGLLLLIALLGGCLEDLSDRKLFEAPVKTDPDMADNNDPRDVRTDMTPCVPETDEELCVREGALCGDLTVADRCDRARTVNCGEEMCIAPNTCGGGEDDNVCGCTPLSVTAFCGVNGDAKCGMVTGVDNCGTARTETCGTCEDGLACAGNQCECRPETDSEVCAANQAVCGELQTNDNCGDPRMIDCGSCTAPDECNANSCACLPEGDAATCVRLGLTCGIAMVQDNCLTDVTVDCGDTCPTNATCGGGGTANVCACDTQSDTQFCADNSAVCGVLTALDDCANMRTVNCGPCPAFQTCGGAMTANQCGCTPESDPEFCSRRAVECGSSDGLDNCGVNRTVNCGQCSAPETCDAVTAGQCDCVPGSNAEFCLANGDAQCGIVSGMNRCGQQRTTDCGSCAAGFACQNKQCVCAPETDTQYCDRNNACGAVNFPDNCGTPRNVNCLACGPGEGQCMQGKCSVCVPETNPEFCMRVGSLCGSTTALDNCGVSRTTVCGQCQGADQGCVNNACMCVSNDGPAELCPSNSCGSINLTNSCNVAADIDCGSCATDYECFNERCRCKMTSDSQLCARENYNCGNASIQYCGMTRMVNCGSCTVCTGNRCIVP